MYVIYHRMLSETAISADLMIYIFNKVEKNCEMKMSCFYSPSQDYSRMLFVVLTTNVMKTPPHTPTKNIVYEKIAALISCCCYMWGRAGYIFV